ncbi:dipeptide/oligopeptide/nickel ABC transporter ATP-binding protein [Halobacteriales archaeon SW_7_68_16]|nr:MAG: dipeptide/oligopeptide/nickel ABC transporter ATP-binding protein [Halobacteriales archaeon SW_7_68_16]
MARADTTADETGEDRDPIVEIRTLRTAFYTDKETIRAVDGVSFDVGHAETVGIVGESGSGKSVTARSMMGLVESPGRVEAGSAIRFREADAVERFADRYGRYTVDLPAVAADRDLPALIERLFQDYGVRPGDLTDDPTYATAAPGEVDAEAMVADDAVAVEDLIDAGYGEELGLVDERDFVFVEDRADGTPSGYIDIRRAPENALQKLRGGSIAMVFQDPLSSLNPVYTVGNQIKEALRLHQGMRGAAATDEAIELLEAVGIPDARRRVEEYPHQFSGGMRQRAVIAMALACDPELLICDEPTTALDVTIQAQILELLDALQRERGLSIVFITHDMGVIAEVSDRVNVMYAGEIVESAPVEALFENPRHPYTRGLLRSIPGHQEGEKLETIEGDVPTPNEPATYCRFAPRCPKAFEDCDAVHPSNVSVTADAIDHTAACLLYPEDRDRESAIDRHRSMETDHE